MITKNKYYLVSPYLFSLSVIGLVGMVVCYSLIFYFVGATFFDKISNGLIHEWIWLCLFIGAILFAYITANILDGFIFWGIVKINCDGVAFYAPFRKKIYFPYNDIKYIGIDFSLINGQRQYWIYMSKEPVYPKYFRKINRMPFTSQNARIQYSESVCANLFSVLPQPLEKQLQNSKTILSQK